MKISEAISTVGRCVSYYPKLAGIFGVNESIFICQFIYWIGKESAGDGWVYKERTQIEDETGLSYKQQRRVRAVLKKRGVLEERYERTTHQMYYRIDAGKVDAEFLKYLTNGQLPFCQEAVDQRASGSCPKGKSSYTEITTENTQRSNPTLEERKKVFVEELRSYLKSVPGSMPIDEARKFLDYWVESSGKKMRWEMQKTWELPRRIKRWMLNQKDWNRKSVESFNFVEKKFYGPSQIAKDSDIGKIPDRIRNSAQEESSEWEREKAR